MLKQIKIIFKCLLCLPFIFILSSCAEYVALELAAAAVSSLNKSSSSISSLNNSSSTISSGVNYPLNNDTRPMIDLKSENDSKICRMAIDENTKLFSLKSQYREYVIEAKFRGLNCGIKKIESAAIQSNTNKVNVKSYSPLKNYSNNLILSNACSFNGFRYTRFKSDVVSKQYVAEAKSRGLDCGMKENIKSVISSRPKNIKPSISSVELEKEKQKRIALQRKLDKEERKRKAQEKRIAELEKKNKELQKPNQKQLPKSRGVSGSGFFISKLGHIITNEHVVKKCNKITVGDNIDRQVPAKLIEVDRKNDLALLRTTTLDLASSETKSLIKKLSTQKLGIEIVPLATAGLMRSNDIELGEDIVVAGFPYGDIFSKDIKVTFGNVNSTKGVGDDSSQFQIQAPVQIGNSGGPIYDKYGNIVGVVVAQLDKLKMAKTIGSLPENVNFGIKASTVKQFLNSSGLPTKWAERNKEMSNKEISQIASKQTVMVVCHR